MLGPRSPYTWGLDIIILFRFSEADLAGDIDYIIDNGGDGTGSSYKGLV